MKSLPAENPVAETATSGTLPTPEDVRARLVQLRLRKLAQPKPEVVTARGAQSAPLSFAQEGLWFLDRLTGPGSAYNIARAFRLRGALDVLALERSLVALVERHESLRTAFESQGASVRQVVRDHRQVAQALRLEPVAPCEADGHGQALAEHLRRDANEPFDLGRAPLLRARLYRLGREEHVLLVVVHHISSDGWSMGVLARELGDLYATRGNAALLPPLPLQFNDFALWQRERGDSEPLRRQLDYWRRQLAGVPPLELPSDRPRAHRASQRGDAISFELPPPLVTGLNALALRERATPYMVLLAAFKVLLMRYCGQDDVVVGSPNAGRSHPAFEGLIGYFVNTLALRTDLSGEPTFLELLGRVRRTALDAYANAEVPFDRLVAELCPQREVGRNPLYQVAFSLHNEPVYDLRLAGLQTEAIDLPVAAAKFDLALSLREAGAALGGTLEFNADLFDAATVQRMARHFQNLLSEVAARPGQSIARLQLMDDAERSRILRSWNETARPLPEGANLHQLFERQVARAPEAIAIAHDSTRLSYAELNTRANRLAHRLRARGVCPDALVGLCLQRGPAMVVAMLAIVKAGGAYLPLDPDYPQERLRFMIEDAAASLVLVEHSLRDRVPASAPVLCIDSPEPDEYPDVDPCAVARPDDLAYVIYTSGSTGTPKGVAVPQRGVIRLVLETDYVRIDARDTIAQASNSSFDAATFEIWGALLAGARLAIVGKERLLSGSALEQEIDRHGITTMFMTTALFNEHAARTPALFSRLATLLVGGEAIDAATVQRVLDAGPPRRLINAYGPTETTTFATWYEIPRHRVAPPIPIGRPISNTRCHILDALMQPVPVGVIGDLYVGGPGLARGYLNRDALTAERFVADPFEAGERLYRTGDRARYRADGQIVYCGRSDQQVKLRGFRIELGEIEDALAQQAGVRQCCIVVREDEPNNRRLVAYVVAESGATITGEFLRTLLAQRLPSYMVPSAVVLMQALPLTANGKLDRDALPRPPAPGSGGPESGMDELERQLSQLWAGVLGVASVGVDDSFFDLGGHSLLAIRLLDAVDKCWGRTLGLASLFEAPTVRAQAALLRSDAPRAGSVSSCAVAVQPAGHRPPLFFVSGYGGALLPFRALAGALGTDQPLYVLDFNSMADLSEDDAVVTVERIATRMLVDMRRIQPHGPYHLAGFSLGGKIVYEMAQQLHRDGESTRLLALLDCAAPGYPRMRSFPVRALLHIRHALAHDRREALRYIADRVLMLRKYFWRVDRKLFEGDDDAGATAVAREIETRSKAAYDAWRAYVPARYAGHITLIAAGRRAYQPGVIRDDPMMGWPALVAGGVDLATLPCDHVQMLDEPYAPELARLLAKRISPEPLASHMG